MTRLCDCKTAAQACALAPIVVLAPRASHRQSAAQACVLRNRPVTPAARGGRPAIAHNVTSPRASDEKSVACKRSAHS